MTRSVALDTKLLASARGGRVLALDARAVGSLVHLHSERPAAAEPREAAVDAAAGLPPTRATVGVVDVMGPLSQRGEEHPCGYVDGYDWIGDRLAAALDACDAVVLRIDSPGGDVAGLEESVRRMRAAADVAGKRIVAYVDELAASAAYWIAAGVADHIVIPRGGCVGSIGSFAMFVDATAASAADGLAVTIVRDPAGKAAGHPLGPVTDVAIERLQEQVSASTEDFITAVATRRGLSTTVLRALDGATLRGADAVAARLADAVGTFDDALRAAAQYAVASRGPTMPTAPAPVAAPATARAEDMPAEPQQPEPEKKPAAAVPIEDGKCTCPECGAVFDVAPPMSQPGEPAPAEREALAAASELLRVTGAESLMGAVARVAEWKAAIAAHDTAERTSIVRKMVADGAIIPADAWADADAGKVAPMFASMPIAELRQRAEQRAAVPAAMRRVVPMAASADMSADEAEQLKRRGIDPQRYLATKAAVLAARAR